MTELLNTLYVQTQGASLHLDQDSVRIWQPDSEDRRTMPLRRLDGIVLYGNVTMSSQLLARCAKDGRAVVWMNRSGRFLARLDGPTRGNVLLRHAQHLLNTDNKRRLGIARHVVVGKIQNSRLVLLRGARDAEPSRQTQIRESAADCAAYLDELADTCRLDDVLGYEGRTARTYYEAFALLLRADSIPPMNGRNRRPPTDPVNAVLSFLYGLTRSLVHGAIEQVGLDPYIGYLHGIRPGKPALALDLMEEFRPILADRLALNLLNRRQLQAPQFETLPGGAVQLTEDGRKTVLTEWQRWKQREWQHRLLKRKVPAMLLPVIQARILARHIRDELPAYVPWRPT